MIFNGKEVPFPAIGKISFFKILENIEEKTNDKDPFVSETAKNLLIEAEKYPEIRSGIDNIENLGKCEGLVRKLCLMMFPDVLTTNEIKALTPPFYFKPIYSSERFKKIINASGEDFSLQMKDITGDDFYLICCYFILASYYGYQSHAGGPLIVEIFNRNLGINKAYQVAINADMMDFSPTDRAVEISRKDFELLVNNYDNIDLWKEKFPPNSWTFRGVNVINMMDVTNSRALSNISSSLLVKSEESLQKIRAGLRSLFNNGELKSGVVTMEDGYISQIHNDDMNMKSIILGGITSMKFEEGLCGYSIEKLVKRNVPLIIPDVKQFHAKSNSQLSQSLIDQNIGSFIMIPLIYEDELMGFIELGSTNKYELNSVSISKLLPLIPVLSMAIKRFRTEEQNQIEAIIQQECTTIHGSVKWRFKEEAKKFFQAGLTGKQPVFNDIIFKDVVPLYGQLDIKGSSTRRNKAVKSDLLSQLNLIGKVLNRALLKTNIIAYDELIFRINGLKKEIGGELSTGNEHKIFQFIKQEIDPVFAHLKNEDSKLQHLVEDYYARLDAELKTLYIERKKYDSSVDKINHVLVSALDKKQEEAQQIFPHYFERYKTDGVEFNMYIGQSMANNANYNPIYLRNLRIWQLLTMWSLEIEYRNLKKDLDVDIEIASLILAYGTPLSLHFRMDEKRFDVEGAYNARYEIIKKRIDKALIKGTKERLTQPEKMTIVYSQEQESKEYMLFINFLQSKGCFKNDLENLQLEDLQGIRGLRALRVGINYSNETSGLSIDEFIKSVESVN